MYLYITYPIESADEEEEKQEQIVQEGNGWTTLTHPILLRPFTTPSGPVGFTRSCTSPLHIFRLFSPSFLIQHIVNCMNEYVNSKNEMNWTATNSSELYCFIGLLIYMGIDHLPQLSMYWSSIYSHLFVSSAFSRNRFKQLTCFLVSTRAEQIENPDKLKKVRWFSEQ